MTAYLVHPFVLIRNTLKKAKIALMPLFLDSGPSVTMKNHSMITSKKALQYLSCQLLQWIISTPKPPKRKQTTSPSSGYVK